MFTILRLSMICRLPVHNVVPCWGPHSSHCWWGGGGGHQGGGPVQEAQHGGGLTGKILESVDKQKCRLLSPLMVTKI